MIIYRAIRNIFHKVSQFYLDRRVIWKLIGGFGLILIILLIIVEISQMSLQLFNRKLFTVIDEELEPMVYLNDIRSSITELEIGAKDAILQKDQVALAYIRNEFLPNTVQRTVDYSLKKLSKSVSSIEMKGKFQEISQFWQQYYRVYENLLADAALYQSSEFRQKANQIRFFLIGGMDRIVETHFRQQAVLAKSEAVNTYRKQQRVIWSLVGAAILLMIFISIVTTWMIVKPLRLMANASRNIAKGDLKVELPENRRDEFGEVAGCYNLMTAELTFLVENINFAAGGVNENSRILLDGVSATSAITQQLIDTLTSIASGASTQQMKVSSIHKAVQTMTSFSQSVSEITAQVARLANDTVSKALHGENVSDEVVEKIQQIREFMSKSGATIGELQSLGREIEKMALLMQDIADETNLLSLNASIEAARAGDFGRGFGIVAKSIGKLAEGTKETALHTQVLVGRIQQMFTNLIQMIQTENRVINEGEQAAAALDSVFVAIINAAKEVDLALIEVNHQIQHLAGDHDEMLKAVEEITEIAIFHKEGTTQVSATAGEHFSCTQEIISAGEILVNWGENLRQAVDKFNIKTATHARNEWEHETAPLIYCSGG